MNPPSLREICAKATPGPWKRGPYGGLYTEQATAPCIIAATHSDGTLRSNGINNEELIARFSPATALAVYEALEAIEVATSTKTGYQEAHDFVINENAKRALNLLDGRTEP